jgi:hypothetical protein
MDKKQLNNSCFFLFRGKIMHESNFKVDLQNSKEAEKIVLSVLAKCAFEDKYFEDVSDIPDFWHYGDIVVRDRDGMFDCFIDVKDDSRIADTRNILCEERVYYTNNNQFKEGFMYSGYDYIAIVSKKEKKIYIIDFKKLQKHYKEGRSMCLSYGWQYSDIFLYPLDKAYKYNMVVAEIEYKEYKKDSISYYYPLSIKKYDSYLNMCLGA